MVAVHNWLIYAHSFGAICCFTLVLISLLYTMMADEFIATKFLRRASMIGILFYALSCSSMAYRCGNEAQFDAPHQWHELIILYISSGTWRLARMLTYLIFIKRLQYIFNGTQYELSTKTYRFMYGLCITFALIDCIQDLLLYFWIYHTFGIDEQNDLSKILLFRAISYILSCIIASIVCLSIMVLFISKLSLLFKDVSTLRALTGDIDDADDDMFNTENIDESINISNSRRDNTKHINSHRLISLSGTRNLKSSKQVAIVKIMSKITILSVMFIITSTIMMILSIFVFFDKFANVIITYRW
eukprot:327447_1